MALTAGYSGSDSVLRFSAERQPALGRCFGGLAELGLGVDRARAWAGAGGPEKETFASAVRLRPITKLLSCISQRCFTTSLDGGTARPSCVGCETCGAGY